MTRYLLSCQTGSQKSTGIGLIVGVIYCSPNSSVLHSESLNELTENLGCTTKDVIFLADWNYFEIDWRVSNCKTLKHHPAYHFLEAVK